MKIFAVFVLVLAGLVSTHGDTTQTQTWDVVAACQLGDSVAGFPCIAPSVISATFTTQLETGNFAFTSEPTNFCTVPCTEPVVTGISGTFDGQSMTLTISPGPFDWLLVGCPTCGALPEGVDFTANGNAYTLWWDGYTFLTTDTNGATSTEVMDWSAAESSPVPEPSTILLLTVPLLLALSRWAQLSLRKYSARYTSRNRVANPTGLDCLGHVIG